MERDNSGKIIAIVALVVAVIGLSLGFAAFSSYLTIDTAANVSTGTGNWSVGFGTTTSSMADISTPTQKPANASNPGILNVTKYTLTQNTNATLSTTAGSSVSYDLYILNQGNVKAYLDEVNFDNLNLTCSNATGNVSTLVEGSSNAGTYSYGGNSTTISPADCASMFDVTLSIDSTSYTSTTHGDGTQFINAGSNVPVTLTIAYNSTTGGTVANSLDGDIVVSIGTISVVYTSSNPSGN